MKNEYLELIKKYGLDITYNSKGDKGIRVGFGKPSNEEISYIKTNREEFMETIEELKRIETYNKLHPSIVKYGVWDSDEWETLRKHNGYRYTNTKEIIETILKDNDLETTCLDRLYKQIEDTTYDKFFEEYYVQNEIEKGRWQEWYYEQLLELSKENKAPGWIKIPYDIFKEYVLSLYDECNEKQKKSDISRLENLLKEMGNFEELVDTRKEANKIRAQNYQFNCECSDEYVAAICDHYIYSKEDYIETLEQIAKIKGEDVVLPKITTKNEEENVIEEFEVDYSIYKNYFSSFKKVPNSYYSHKISLYVNKEQKEQILAKLKELEDLEKQREDLVVDYTIYKECLKEHFNYKNYDNGKVTLHLLPHNIEKAKELIKEYEDKFVETIVLYKDYKKLFEGKGYRKGKYNKKDGTIIVYLPKGVVYERKSKDKHYEDRFAFKNGYLDELIITPTTINPDDIEVEVPECLKN